MKLIRPVLAFTLLFAIPALPQQKSSLERLLEAEVARMPARLFDRYTDLFAGSRKALVDWVVKNASALAESIRNRPVRCQDSLLCGFPMIRFIKGSKLQLKNARLAAER